MPSPADNFVELTRWESLGSEVERIITDFDVVSDQIAVISKGMTVDALANQIQIGLPYNSPGSLVLDSQLRFSCQDLRRRGVNFVMVASDALGPSLKRVLRCAGFLQVSVFPEGVTFQTSVP